MSTPDIRDEFAGIALREALRRSNLPERYAKGGIDVAKGDAVDVALWCYVIADAMVSEREKRHA